MQTIPAYRMTDADVETDRARLRGLDIRFVPSTKVGRDLSFDRLMHEEGYAAVLLAIGTPAHRSLSIPGEDLPGVLPALEFLKQVNEGHPPALGPRVMVVGGGDVAMDSVRSALRLAHGGHVTLFYRRSRAEMPADPEEVHGAEAEGVELVFLRAPVRFVGTARVQGLVVESMELGPPDAGGRRSPVRVPGSETTVPVDTVIVAVGEQADLTGFDARLGLRLDSRGWPEGKGPGYATDVPGVFATGGRSVVYAMGAAAEAAAAIDAYLAARRGEAPAPRPDPFGGTEPFHPPPGYTTPIRV